LNTRSTIVEDNYKDGPTPSDISGSQNENHCQSCCHHGGRRSSHGIAAADAPASVTDQPAYGLLDAGIAFTTNSGAWRFALDGKNLLDRWYRVAGYDFGGTGTGLLANVSQIGFYGPPRTYLVTAQYHY
jgi:outer membrane receptor protein involved in Fe transport